MRRKNNAIKKPQRNNRNKNRPTGNPENTRLWNQTAWAGIPLYSLAI